MTNLERDDEIHNKVETLYGCLLALVLESDETHDKLETPLYGSYTHYLKKSDETHDIKKAC